MLKETIKEVKTFDHLGTDTPTSNSNMVTGSGKSKGEYHYEDQYYMDIVDPKTGKPYLIPLLTMQDPEYLSEYAYFMRLKERNEPAFQNILNWG